MRNLTESEKQAFEAYVEKENQRIAHLPLKNARRFFVDDTPPKDFNEDLDELKNFALKSFILLDEDYKPDGLSFYDLISKLEYFQLALKEDSEPSAVELDYSGGFYKEKCEQLEEKATMLNREIGGLEYLLENYLKNRLFYEQIKQVVTDYTNGHKTEQETITGFLSSIKEHWNIVPGNNDFFEQLKHNALFMAMANLTAIDYMSGYKTEQETQQRFIEYTRQFWKHSKQEKLNPEFQPMKEAV
jgi:hypothetical protein